MSWYSIILIIMGVAIFALLIFCMLISAFGLLSSNAMLSCSHQYGYSSGNYYGLSYSQCLAEVDSRWYSKASAFGEGLLDNLFSFRCRTCEGGG